MDDVSKEAKARGWRLEFDSSDGIEFPYTWFRPDGTIHDCYSDPNHLALFDIRRFLPIDPEIHKNMTLDELVRVCHEKSKAAGWWEAFDRCTSTEQTQALYGLKIALIHSETSEMLEGLRKGVQDNHLPERTMEEVEAADIALRLFDYCGARGLDLLGAMIEKIEYNAQRTDHTLEARAEEGGKSF